MKFISQIKEEQNLRATIFGIIAILAIFGIVFARFYLSDTRFDYQNIQDTSVTQFEPISDEDGDLVGGASKAPLDFSGTITATSIRTKESPWFDVKAYGAVGNGATDDTKAIQAAYDAAGAAGGGVVFFPAGRYAIDADAPFAWGASKIRLHYSNVKLRGEAGSVIVARKSVPTKFQVIFGPDPAQTVYMDLSLYPTRAVAKGAQSVTLTTPAQAKNFAVGDFIWIRGGTVGSEANAELNIVTSVNAGTGVIGLRYPTAKTYSATPLGVANARPVTHQNLSVENLRFESAITGFNPIQHFGVVFKDVEWIGEAGAGPLMLAASRQTRLKHVSITGQSTALQNPDGIFQIAATVDMVIDRSVFTSTNGEKVLWCSDGSAQVRVTNSVLSGKGEIIIDDCFDIDISRNTIRLLSNTSVAVISGGNGGGTTVGMKLARNQMYLLGNPRTAIVLSGAGSSLIGNNIITDVASGAAHYAISTSGDITGAVIADNHVQLTSATAPLAIAIAATTHGVSVIRNTLIGTNAAGSTGVFLADDGAQTIGPSIMNNFIKGFSTGIQVSNVSHEPGLVVRGNTIIGAATPYDPSTLPQD